MKKNSDMSDKPTFVCREGMTSDSHYVQWLRDIKSRFQKSQIKAAVKVNSAMLEFYWSIGRDIITLQAESKWGSGFFNQLSLDLRTAFSDETGFSVTNLKYMKRWYLFYYERVVSHRQVGDEMDIGSNHSKNDILGAVNCHQVGDEIDIGSNHSKDDILDAVNRHQVGDEKNISVLHRSVSKDNVDNYVQTGDETICCIGEDLEMPEVFCLVPWKHHVLIFSKCQTIDEALFYINKVSEEGWSRSWLEDQLNAKLYNRQAAAISNFDRTLPVPQSQLAQELLKDPYNFSFLTLKAKYNEHDLEEALVTNITHFLLELGKGFAYVGRQMELRMDEGTAFYPDLVFYHIPQKRYVIIELKAVKFEPEFAGKLNFYVTAADELLRGEGDNPSVGLVICKTAKRTIVEWSLKDISKPLGVATYQLEEVVARTVAELEQRRNENQE